LAHDWLIIGSFGLITITPPYKIWWLNGGNLADKISCTVIAPLY